MGSPLGRASLPRQAASTKRRCSMGYKGHVPPSTSASDQPQGGRLRAGFVAGLPFELDRFQALAFDALDAGRSVVVAAPTGSGKTVVAEYAVARALGERGKVFYTTPLKALSNQKYADFSRRLGAASVGLLTGDNSINGDAPVVVMTTEVLRNMVYAGSPALVGLRYVVLDEVHYLQDPYRGPVWEEVIIHLAPEVDLVCLSATVSNAEELADWVGTVRGSTAAVIEDRRPVPLRDLLLLGERPRLVEAGAGTALGKGPRPVPRVGVGAGAALRCSRPSSTVVPTPRLWLSQPTAAWAGGAGAAHRSSPPGGPRQSSCWQTPACCRRSTSSSVVPGATRRCASACTKALP